jgi:uncharacterized protein
MTDILKQLATELKLQSFQVTNTIKLLVDEECTIPFVARYRKEMTGSLDEVQIRAIRDRYDYVTDLESSKEKYLKVVEEYCQKNPAYQGKFPELKRKFQACATKQELEDLYLPFKPKRRTKAQIAREKGLEPLLDAILAQRSSIRDLLDLAKAYVTPENSTIDQTLRVTSPDLALQGASDILAERISETAEIRAIVRQVSSATGVLWSRKIDGSENAPAADSEAPRTKQTGSGKRAEAHKFENYFDFKESISSIPSHRVMAIRRGEAEKILRMGLDVDTAAIIQKVIAQLVDVEPTSQEARRWLATTIEDAYNRLLAPSIETEIRLELKNRAEVDSIRIFTKNLENLLLLPPIPQKIVLGVDPGIRTGSKLAVVSETGALLFNATVYPDFKHDMTLDTDKTKSTKTLIANTIKSYKVQYIAIGNGTASREIDRVIKETIKDFAIPDVKRLIVNESGASVYSADEIAREEFPDLDATIRSAISIARRLQDPLAELVKIDPRSIGVGQYQHDVNVTKLKKSLEDVVESCVNKVGVNLNTASYKLLGYVSGLGASLAKSIVTFRDKNGRFSSRTDLLKVPGFGPKAFEQAAGFLRVPESKNPLDNSSVHPERYNIIEQVAKEQGSTVADLVGKPTVVNAIAWEKYVSDIVGLPTLRDIASELIKPGRDPREDGIRLSYSDEVSEISDLKPGMVLQGTVTNVISFGAFVDIGVHQDGLVHISELSDQFVSDPSTVVSVGDVLKVRVMEVDVAKKRISLSARTTPKQPTTAPSAKPTTDKPPQKNPMHKNVAPHVAKNANTKKDHPPAPSYSVNDLLGKFGRK